MICGWWATHGRCPIYWGGTKAVIFLYYNVACQWFDALSGVSPRMSIFYLCWSRKHKQTNKQTKDLGEKTPLPPPPQQEVGVDMHTLYAKGEPAGRMFRGLRNLFALGKTKSIPDWASVKLDPESEPLPSRTQEYRGNNREHHIPDNILLTLLTVTIIVTCMSCGGYTMIRVTCEDDKCCTSACYL